MTADQSRKLFATRLGDWLPVAAILVVAETLMIGPLAFKLDDTKRWAIFAPFVAILYLAIAGMRALERWGAKPDGRAAGFLVESAAQLAVALWLTAIIAPQAIVSHPVKAALSLALAIGAAIYESRRTAKA